MRHGDGREYLSRNADRVFYSGGTLGTGLFIGSGQALSTAGPVGALIAYMFVGTIVYSVMISLGEMTTCIPISGAFTSYAAGFVDPTLGFSMGWIYWFSWATTYAVELTASGLIIQYWAPQLSIGIFIGVFWLLITAINFMPVSFYGEFEFWFASIKVITVLGFLIFGICIDAGAGQNGYLGFSAWVNPGAFAPYLVENNDNLAKFVGFWAVLIQAGFSYQGTELVAIAAGETENPRKNVPAAIRKTFYRILFFFVFSIFFLGLLIPYDTDGLLSSGKDANASPFVLAIKLAGVPVLPGIINAVLLFVVLSAANSNVYAGSRILLALSVDGSAPKFLRRTSVHGVPYVAVGVTAAFGLLAFLNLSATAGTVFTWLMNMSAVAGFITWACINLCHIRFMRILAGRQISRDTLPYKAFGQPFFAWFGLVFNIIIIFTQGFRAFTPWDTASFFAAYISLIVFVVLYVIHKVVKRTRIVDLDNADIITGCLNMEEVLIDVSVGTTWWEKIWAWIS
jgi:amino acid transporter